MTGLKRRAASFSAREESPRGLRPRFIDREPKNRLARAPSRAMSCTVFVPTEHALNSLWGGAEGRKCAFGAKIYFGKPYVNRKIGIPGGMGC